MRKTAVALVLLAARLAERGRAVDATPRAPPKVVIIVGADPRRDVDLPLDADRAYAEAIKYTPNVVKVYSPNATWARVKAAVVRRHRS